LHRRGWTPGRRNRGERGATAVEFALISIPFFVLLIGIVQFSIWFWAYQVGSHAAREGARQGAVVPCDLALIQSRVLDRLGDAADGTPTVTTTTEPLAGFIVGDEITVNVTFTPYEIALFSVPDIDKSATARIERIPAGGCP
jgi:TadE-like protein